MRMSCFIAFFDPFGTVVPFYFQKDNQELQRTEKGVNRIYFCSRETTKNDDFLDLLWTDANRRLVASATRVTPYVSIGPKVVYVWRI